MLSSSRSADTDKDKQKQSSLLDFFSRSSNKPAIRASLDKNLQKQKGIASESFSNSTKSTPKKRKLLVTTSSSKKMEEKTDLNTSKSNSCPSRLLEALDDSDVSESYSNYVQNNSCDGHVTEIPETQESKLVNEPVASLFFKPFFGITKRSPKERSVWSCNKSAVNDESPSLFDSEPDDMCIDVPDESKSSPTPPERLSLGLAFEKLRTVPQCSRPLSPLQSSSQHTVIFDETFSGNAPPPVRYPKYRDAWDSSHVRLPCSSRNLYPVKIQGEEDSLQRRWMLIESSLMSPINNSVDLEEAILKYNSRYANQWSFRALHKLFTDDVDDDYRKEFFSITLPEVIKLALSLPSLCTQPIPLLSRQKNHKITLTQQQIACLLCNAFLCTFPWRNSKRSKSEYSQYPDINFNRLLCGSSQREDVIMEKLKMIFHYFKRVTTDMPNGTVTFERRALRDFPNWKESPCTLCGLHISSEGMIENEGAGMLQVDFANRFLGGGVLGSGAVQEEIRFCICPELVVSRLLCEALDDNECVVITGAEQYSSYSGYGNTLQWTGDYIDCTVRDEWRRRTTEIVAIDALSWATHQYSTSNIKRELNKAFCGFFCNFEPDHAPAIATGNWGCGAFGGDPMLKSLLQLMAAATIGRDLCYFTFGDVKRVKEIHEIYSFIVEKELQIRDLWRTLIRYNTEIIMTGAKEQLFEFIKRIFNEYNESTDEDL